MRVAFEHGQRLVPGDRGDLHHGKAAFEQPRCGLMFY